MSSWIAREHQVAAYSPSTKELVLFGGSTSDLLGDTWVRTNGSWARDDTQPSPPARSSAAFAYDANRDVFVLFGGQFASSGNDTWEYRDHPRHWVQIQPPHQPPGRRHAAMVFDSVAKKLILFGGEGAGFAKLGDTWAYDGADWTKISDWSPSAPNATPPPQSLHAMVWDPARNRAVLVGGLSNAGFDTKTWEYAAGTWTAVTTPGPYDRYAPVMAYSATAGGVLLFGGEIGNVDANELWMYDGTWHLLPQGPVTPRGRLYGTLTASENNAVTLIAGDSGGQLLDDVWDFLPASAKWQAAPAATSLAPSPRRDAPFVLDTKRNRAVYIGGYSTVGQENEIWMFDGETWIRGRQVSSLLSNYAATYDSDRDVIVAFGGGVYGSPPNGATYEIANDVLTTSQPSPSPPARRNAAAAYAPDAHVTVLFGGTVDNLDTQIVDDTWEYNGTTWTPITATPHPIGQDRPSMVFDPDRHRIVLFAYDRSTWTYANHTWTQLHPTTTPPGSNPKLAFDQNRRHVVLFGGANEQSTFSDLWELVDDNWQRIDALQSPPPRMEEAFVGLPQGLVMYGGTTNGSTAGTLGDTWLFRWQ